MAHVTLADVPDAAHDNHFALYQSSVIGCDDIDCNSREPHRAQVCPPHFIPISEIGDLPLDCPELVAVTRLDQRGRVQVGEICEEIGRLWGRTTYTWTIRQGDVVFLIAEDDAVRGLCPDEEGRLQVPHICRAVLDAEPGDELLVLASNASIVLRRAGGRSSE